MSAKLSDTAMACREMTFEEAIDAGNIEHAKKLYKRQECRLVDNRNRYECEISELRWGIARLQFLVDKLLDAEMDDDENRRMRENKIPKYPRKAVQKFYLNLVD